MSLFQILDIAGSGMLAQNLRLNTTASNLANANSVSSSINETYRARHTVFSAELAAMQRGQAGVGVQVKGIVESDKPLVRQYQPDHPLADNQGYIYKPNVNVVEEMANMMSASRSYQANVQVALAAKEMTKQTLKMGR